MLSANLHIHSATLAATTVSDPTRDGWENDEWGSLEEEPANEELEEKSNHVNASRSNSNSQSHSSSGVYNNNIVSKNGDGDTLLNSSSNSNWENNGTGWNEDEFEPTEDTISGESTLNFQLFSNLHLSIPQQIQNSTRHVANVKKRNFNDSVRWKLEGRHAVVQ